MAVLFTCRCRFTSQQVGVTGNSDVTVQLYCIGITVSGRKYTGVNVNNGSPTNTV